MMFFVTVIQELKTSRTTTHVYRDLISVMPRLPLLILVARNAALFSPGVYIALCVHAADVYPASTFSANIASPCKDVDLQYK